VSAVCLFVVMVRARVQAGALVAYNCVVFLIVIPLFLLVSYNNTSDIVIDPEFSKYNGPSPSNNSDETLIMMQVSDIHVSKFHPEYLANFNVILNSIIPAIKPRAVFVSGDITDGFETDRSIIQVDGLQQREEWQAYQTALIDSGVLNKTIWRDMRGNHDAYGTGLPDDVDMNLYETYGSTSKTNNQLDDDIKRTSWSLDISVSQHSVYRFIGLDTTTEGGLTLAFNFYGYVSSVLRYDAINHIEKNPVTSSILIGHQPESSLSGGLGQLVDRVPYYLCGHVHATDMKQRISKATIELELADLKVNRMFRVMAWDHGMFSFNDVSLDSPFPTGMITQPKDARYLSQHEPFFGSNISHVRVLAFTSDDASIVSVSIKFNDDENSQQAVSAGTNLFVLEWKAADYSNGWISATVTDLNNSSV